MQPPLSRCASEFAMPCVARRRIAPKDVAFALPELLYGLKSRSGGTRVLFGKRDEFSSFTSAETKKSGKGQTAFGLIE